MLVAIVFRIFCLAASYLKNRKDWYVTYETIILRVVLYGCGTWPPL